MDEISRLKTRSYSLMQDSRTSLTETPGLGRISACSCGAIHVKIGPVELTLDPDAFVQAAIMFRRAALALEPELMAATDSMERLCGKASLLTH
jgi:hypothetical protein